MQQVSVVALFGRRYAPAESLKRISAAAVTERQTCGPRLVGERWIGHDDVIGPQLFAVLELRRSQCVAGKNIGCREIMQDHIHAGETGSGHVLFLPLQRNPFARLRGDLQQQ